LSLFSGLCILPVLSRYESRHTALSTDDTNVLAEFLHDLFSNTTSAIKVGNACIAEWGSVPASEWVAEMCATLDGEEFVDSRDLAAIIENRIREDFTRERTIGVQGWILSRTEATLCCLAANTLHS
jgi:hypothetical protein